MLCAAIASLQGIGALHDGTVFLQQLARVDIELARHEQEEDVDDDGLGVIREKRSYARELLDSRAKERVVGDGLQGRVALMGDRNQRASIVVGVARALDHVGGEA